MPVAIKLKKKYTSFCESSVASRKNAAQLTKSIILHRKRYISFLLKLVDTVKIPEMHLTCVEFASATAETVMRGLCIILYIPRKEEKKEREQCSQRHKTHTT
ncbi:unnamed protein product [Ixodes pacificus]